MTDARLKPFPLFGARLRRLRRATGVKQSALAQELSVDQTTVSRWEAGQQMPCANTQHRVFRALNCHRSDDAALRRLVESSADTVHLVDETTHICLAYSRVRARDWRTSQRALLGVSLWQYATEEIRQAEAELVDSDWWTAQNPSPKAFQTSARTHDEISIRAGGILWERLYLSDGTPVRLVTGT